MGRSGTKQMDERVGGWLRASWRSHWTPGGVGDKTLRVGLCHVWCRCSEQLEGWGLGGIVLRESCY